MVKQSTELVFVIAMKIAELQHPQPGKEEAFEVGTGVERVNP